MATEALKREVLSDEKALKYLEKYAKAHEWSDAETGRRVRLYAARRWHALEKCQSKTAKAPAKKAAPVKAKAPAKKASKPKAAKKAVAAEPKAA